MHQVVLVRDIYNSYLKD